MRAVMIAVLIVAWSGAAVAADAENPLDNTAAAGYRGIWFTLGQFGPHGDKYSGGLGTYTAKHVPLAVYSAETNTTFFTYGGTTDADARHLLVMAGAYDHATGQVRRPVVVCDKLGVNDPHDNGSIALDDEGHVWIFVSGRGRHRPGFVYRSRQPHDIGAFDRLTETEMTYPQPWFHPGRGFLLLFTKYTAGRELYWRASADGKSWSEDHKLAGMGGHYQVSRLDGDNAITAFNMHPGGNVDKRTNLYFLQTPDHGASWRTVDGAIVETPLTDPQGAGLVRDYAAEGKLVYMKDIGVDAAGRPAVLHIVSAGYQAGPNSEPRVWTIAHWDGAAWHFREVARSTHNYDIGSLYIEGDLWRVVGPTEAGPQQWGTGGEMALWESRDGGVTWAKTRDITRGSAQNHMYARRPVNAHSGFYAFWADGNPDELSPSHLYFTNRTGEQVWRLPYTMTEDRMAPEPIMVGGAE